MNSDVSAGQNTFDDIARTAVALDLDFVVFTDQLIVRGEYCLPPFRHLLRYSKERPSVVSYGISEYLSDITSTQRQFPDLVLIPGVDVAPIYQWSGSLFGSGISGRRWSEQITVLGSDDVGFYRDLPAIHNDQIGVRFPDTPIKLIPLVCAFLGCLIASRAISRYRDQQGNSYFIYDKPRIIIGSVFALLSIFCFVGARPMSITTYNQYRDNGIEPFQRLIDYVQEHDALAFWSHPEIEMDREYGPFLPLGFGNVRLHTSPYLKDVVSTFRHNGLAGIYADKSSAHLPEKEWDFMLSQYCRGLRKTRPVIVGEVDYHGDRRLDSIVTVVAVANKSHSAVLTARKKWRLICTGRRRNAEFSP